MKTDDVIQFNKFSNLNSEEILFCKTDHLSDMVNKIASGSQKYIVIIGNSAYSVNERDVDRLRDTGKIHKIYAVNMNSDQDIVQGLPLGIENSTECNVSSLGYGVAWGFAKIKLEQLYERTNDPQKLIYANFSTSTNNYRAAVYDICQQENHIDWERPTSDPFSRSAIVHFYNQISQYKMVVSPEGMGFDCVRTWETLYLGRVPIVKTSKAMMYFVDLPIIFVDEWEELRDLASIQCKYEKVKNNSREMLNFQYWKELILHENR